jgi:hypothetical protein
MAASVISARVGVAISGSSNLFNAFTLGQRYENCDSAP